MPLIVYADIVAMYMLSYFSTKIELIKVKFHITESYPFILEPEP